MIHKKKGIFITATGTDVGKTYVTALILKKLPPYQVYLSLLNNWYLTSMNLQFPHIWQHNWKNVQLI